MIKLLLIEDSPADASLFREALRQTGVPTDVMVVEDGEAASKILAGPSFDLVIVDLDVPRLNGFQLLKSHAGRNGHRFVVFSGSPSADHQEEALRLGAATYLVKPADWEQYLRTVRRILDHCASAQT